MRHLIAWLSSRPEEIKTFVIEEFTWRNILSSYEHLYYPLAKRLVSCTWFRPHTLLHCPTIGRSTVFQRLLINFVPQSRKRFNVGIPSLRFRCCKILFHRSTASTGPGGQPQTASRESRLMTYFFSREGNAIELSPYLTFGVKPQ